MASSMVGNKGLAMLLAMGVAILANAGREKGHYGGKGNYGDKSGYGEHGKGNGYMKDSNHGKHGKGGFNNGANHGGYDEKGHGGHRPHA
ncbi:hypothetical protein L7F22_063082 [Adiantum nelumboides]|nr:hypothetical protein [Adiantum nelumboides]